MKSTISLLLCLFFLFPVSSSAAKRRKDRKRNVIETPADSLLVQKPIDTILIVSPDTLKTDSVPKTAPAASHKLTAKDTITDNDIVLPEGLANGVDTLISEEVDHLQPPVHRKGGNIDYPDSVYIQRLCALPAIIELPYNSVVKGYISLYTEKRRELVEKLLALNLYYEPIFEQELDKMGLPIEQKYLPVIESALRPNAVSPVGATGLWQFMIGTARMMGLEVNSVVDERRDPYKSTQQALRYLQQLHDNFGDWTLAIAAYNCGPGNVNKAIRRSGGKRDYWDIYPYLPRETRGYVPAFIAANYIMNYYDLHNIQPGEIELPSETDTVLVNKRLHFKQISDVLGIEVGELRQLNPQYRRDVVPATAKRPYFLVLPEESAYAFVENEDSICNHQSELYARRITAELAQASRTPIQGYHRVRSGENLSVIAHRYRTSVANLKRWNNLKSNNIYPGMRLAVSSSYAKTRSSAKTTATKSTRKAETWITNGVRYYKVRPGDSLWEISRQFPGLTVQALKNANSLNSNNLKPGQILKIP